VTVAAAVLALTLTGCPKRHKPPAMSRVWLGPTHGCALEKEGRLACWGANDDGQIGDGTTQGRPFTTHASFPERPDEIAIGADMTCGIFAGKVRCWGMKRWTASVQPTMAPVDVDLTSRLLKRGADPGPPLEGVTRLVASRSEMCAMLPGAGEPRCWSSSLGEHQVPHFIHGQKVSLMGGGGAFLCARLESPSRIRCQSSGYDWFPRTRDDDGENPPMPPDLLPNADVISLATGAEHACAVLHDGTVSCWGGNAKGQLGDGTTQKSIQPVPVHGLPRALSIHLGSHHTCARLQTNTVSCWGDNTHYQLANGTTDPGRKPAPIPGLTGVVELAVAGDSNCARLTDGSVRCWGGNAVGQLGDGSTMDNTVPMPLKWRATDR